MSVPQVKYNPGIHGDEELIRSFVVRKVELDLALETLRENAAAKHSSNQHLLFVGPRGIGKTMLVRRVAAEVRKAPELSSAWYPIVFGEESYEVCSPGEFWVEGLFHLSEQTGEERWRQAHKELSDEGDEARLRDRALAHLLDFADREGKRILLVVENLHRLLGEQIEPSRHWDLRHTFQNERRIMLLGTATTRFEEIDNIDKAWFEMFAIRELKPLDLDECTELWRSTTGSEAPPGQVRAVQILTGGNPRLLVILAGFAAKRSFRELMEELTQLVDDHTEYFKSHLDNLPAVERKVFAALLDIWDPVGAREVARAVRMGANNVSMQLSRLVGRGAVQIVRQDGRRKLYQAAERLFNIYYLMRRRGYAHARVRAAVEFMVQFYEPQELAQIIKGLAKEARQLPLQHSKDHLSALALLLASDRAREALEMLSECPAVAAPEPLTVGLRIYLGESPLVAQEILEVGKDVAQRIREMRAAFEKAAIPSTAPPAPHHIQ